MSNCEDVQRFERQLIVVTGPVGGGKSTTAIALAACLRRKDASIAVIDLDQIYCMARQRDGFDEPRIWIAARRAAATLANSFFDSGMDVVIIDGEFFTDDERRQL